MEEPDEDSYENSPYQAPIRQPSQPIPIRHKRPAPPPPMPAHKPLMGFFRPQSERSVILQVESVQPEPSTSASSGVRIELVYEETPRYDTIYEELA